MHVATKAKWSVYAFTVRSSEKLGAFQPLSPGEFMSSSKWWWINFLAGATAFWVPDLVVTPLFPGSNTPGIEAVLTCVCPGGFTLFYALVLRGRRTERGGPSTAIFSLLGIWVLAQIFMMLAQTIRGSGFRAFVWNWSVISYFLLSTLIPTRTFEFSMLEGSAGGLILGTLAAIIFHYRFERDRWIIPPGVPFVSSRPH